MTYAAEDLLEEVAYVAAVFHWSLDELLDLEHPDRQRFVALARSMTADDGDDGDDDGGVP